MEKETSTNAKFRPLDDNMWKKILWYSIHVYKFVKKEDVIYILVLISKIFLCIYIVRLIYNSINR